MKWFITGGAGFIGCNTAKRLLEDGHKVIIFDNLSRKGASLNLKWLEEQGHFEFIWGDVRNFSQLRQAFRENKDIDVVLHLAAQVAVTTSVKNPREDFEINAFGTFNVCEAVRQFKPDAILLNASTNKVYGVMKDLKIVQHDKRYKYQNIPYGISEEHPIDFHSPYGCSKGAGDQYVVDYARIYRMRTVNFRQSCIYGPRQFGVEDQGWVAWFIICAVLDKIITIYGDGKQVRDLLFVDDLTNCYLKAVELIDNISGQTYNLGGGLENSLSVLELIKLLEEFLSRKINYTFADWRPGDQRVFICDIKKAKQDLGWEPNVSVKEGVHKLLTWVLDNKSLFIDTQK